MIIKEDDEHHGCTNLGTEPWLRVQAQPLGLWRVALLRSVPSTAAPQPVSWFQCGVSLEVSLSEAAIGLGWMPSDKHTGVKTSKNSQCGDETVHGMTEVTVQHPQC